MPERCDAALSITHMADTNKVHVGCILRGEQRWKCALGHEAYVPVSAALRHGGNEIGVCDYALVT